MPSQVPQCTAEVSAPAVILLGTIRALVGVVPESACPELPVLYAAAAADVDEAVATVETSQVYWHLTSANTAELVAVFSAPHPLMLRLDWGFHRSERRVIPIKLVEQDTAAVIIYRAKADVAALLEATEQGNPERALSLGIGLGMPASSPLRALVP